MKKLFSIFFVLLFSCVAFSQSDFDLEKLLKQKPDRLVNDYTKTLTTAQQDALESKLVAFDDSTTTQIAVVIIPTLNGKDVTDYGVQLGRAWGIGGKEFSNGVLLLIVNGKRENGDRKLYIATGYGVEGALPDMTAKQIIDQVIIPNFKGDDYYGGIDEGTDAIIKAVKGEYKAPAGYRKKKKRDDGIGRYVFLIVILILLMLINKGKGGGGSFMSRRGYAPWTFGNMTGGSGGWSGGGGGSSGGFGGFGGGSFGGGGASGSW